MKFFFPIPPTPSTSLCRACIFQAFAHMLPAQVQEGTRTDACSYEWFQPRVLVISKLFLHSFFNLEVSPGQFAEVKLFFLVAYYAFISYVTQQFPFR